MVTVLTRSLEAEDLPGARQKIHLWYINGRELHPPLQLGKRHRIVTAVSGHGLCRVVPAGYASTTEYVLFSTTSRLTFSLSAVGAVNGFVVLSTGAEISFTGSFIQISCRRYQKDGTSNQKEQIEVASRHVQACPQVNSSKHTRGWRSLDKDTFLEFRPPITPYVMRDLDYLLCNRNVIL